MGTVQPCRGSPYLRHDFLPYRSLLPLRPQAAPLEPVTFTDSSERLSDLENSYVLAENSRLLNNASWFAPHLDHKGASRMLRKTPVGSFLFRLSSDRDYLYSMTVRVRKSEPACSIRVAYKNGYFSLSAVSSLHENSLPKFDSIHELVQYYATENIRRPARERCCFASYPTSRGASLGKVIELRKPVIARLCELQHLCRLAWNRADGQVALTNCRQIPPAIVSYLEDYPYKF